MAGAIVYTSQHANRLQKLTFVQTVPLSVELSSRLALFSGRVSIHA